MPALLTQLLETIGSVQGPLTFWSFIAASVVIALFVILRSNKVHETWSRVIGSKLSDQTLYRSLRLLLILGFSVAMVAILLAFAAPILLEKIRADRDEGRIEGRVRREIADTEAAQAIQLQLESNAFRIKFQEAERLFRDRRDYPNARRLIRELQSDSVSSANRESLGGLITATWYGEGEHREGILEVCRRYQGKPIDDVRFRWDFHAHIRAIALKENFERAEQVINEIRLECNRKDLSPVWIAIPLAKMEYLRNGATVWEEQFVLSLEDIQHLKYVINRYPNDPFLDHAYYFLHRFEAVNRFPDSLIADTSILADAKSSRDSDPQRAAKLYASYLERWPESPRRSEVAESLIGSLIDASDLRSAVLKSREMGSDPTEYRTTIAEYLISTYPRPSVAQICEALTPLDENEIIDTAALDLACTTNLVELFEISKKCPLNGLISLVRTEISDGSDWIVECMNSAWAEYREGKFDAAINGYRSQEEILARWGVTVPKPWRDQQTEVANVLEAREADTPESHFDAGLVLRDSRWIFSNRLAIDEFSEVIDRWPDSDLAPKALYLRAASYRRGHDYQMSLEDLHHFIEMFPTSQLIDDVIAEIGVHYLLVERDGDVASRFFQHVIDHYPHSNAADNSLNWLAWHAVRTDRWGDALKFYARLALDFADRRMGRRAESHLPRVVAITKTARIVPGVLGLELRGYGSKATVHSIVAKSPAERAGLREGDEIVKIDHIDIPSTEVYWDVLSRRNIGSTAIFAVDRWDRSTGAQRLHLEVQLGGLTVYNHDVGDGPFPPVERDRVQLASGLPESAVLPSRIRALVAAASADDWPAGVGDCLRMADDLNDAREVELSSVAYAQALKYPGISITQRKYALAGLVVTRLKLGLPDESLDAIKALLDIDPGNEFATLLRARILNTPGSVATRPPV